MYLQYDTERLSLRILTQSSAPFVLRFFKDNASAFEPWEPSVPQDYYTETYMQRLLAAEFEQFITGKFVRFWVFLKEEPDIVIGTISFSHIIRGSYSCCELGYRFDTQFQGQGYAKESLDFLIPIFMKDQDIHRIQADIHPDNLKSIKLISGLGFKFEGTARESHCIQGVWTDHLRYSLLSSDIPNP